MADHREGYLSVSGGKVWYKITGKNTDGVPLLTIHGGPGVSHDYLEPLENLADERPVVFYDQLGCGRSDRPDDLALWTVERYVEEIHQIREGLNLEKVHILGQSWGTLLAVEYLLTRQPDGVSSLLLSGPMLSASRWVADQRAHISALPDRVRDAIEACEASGDFLSPHYQDAMMEFYRAHVCRLEDWPSCLNRSFETINPAIYAHMWGPSEFTVTGSLKNYDCVDRLKDIQCPVLFTCGAYDEASPETTRFYQSQLPDSAIHVFDDASHEHHLEKPEEFFKIARAFFQKVDEAVPQK